MHQSLTTSPPTADNSVQTSSNCGTMVLFFVLVNSVQGGGSNNYETRPDHNSGNYMPYSFW